MAAFNAGPFIGPAIESLLAQTFRDFELVVVDDGSTDATPAILDRYARSDGRIRVLRNDVNRGLIYTRNRLLQSTYAPFVALADADDIYGPTRLERQMAWMRAHPEVGVCGTAVKFMGEGWIGRKDEVTVLGDHNIRFLMRIMPCLWNTTTVYRRELLEQAKGYRDGFDAGAEDYDLWARLLPVTRFANLPEALVTVRVHPGSITAQGSKTQRNVLKVSARLIEDYLRLPVPIELREDLHCFFMHSGMDVLACQRAFALARAFYSHAASVEAPDTLQVLREQLAESAWTQARYLVYAAPSLSRRLAIEAVRLKPSLLRRGAIYGYAARALAPRTTVFCAKWLLRTFNAAKAASGGQKSR
jgi:glycosyltransferase involved in cell wall biosynthesis